MTSTSKIGVAPFALASGIACVLGVACAMLLPQPSRAAGVYGAVAAAVGALCSLSALATFVDRGAQGALLGFTVGFLARAALVAIGLVASGARGNLALVYVAVFFALYLATQIVEVLFVARSGASS